MKRVLSFCALLSACSQQPAAPVNQATPETEAKPALARPGAFAAEEKTDLFEFEFSWPAEAAAIPELARRFNEEMGKAKSELVAGAEEEKARREKEGFDYTPFMSSTVYQTAGQSARLLSLKLEAASYEGGAHGNFGIGALLWDRLAKSETAFAELFVEPRDRDRLLKQRWCDALNEARAKKRGEPVGSGGLFDDCPSLDDIAIIPFDSDRNERFDKLVLAASPYVAGPWVEGSYEIELAVTTDLIAALKREFRPSFEAQDRQ